jgi:hypothetical protein
MKPKSYRKDVKSWRLSLRRTKKRLNSIKGKGLVYDMARCVVCLQCAIIATNRPTRNKSSGQIVRVNRGNI